MKTRLKVAAAAKEEEATGCCCCCNSTLRLQLYLFLLIFFSGAVLFVDNGPSGKDTRGRKKHRESNVTDTPTDFEMTVLFLVCLKFPSIEQSRTDRRLVCGNGLKRTPKESKEIGQEPQTQKINTIK